MFLKSKVKLLVHSFFTAHFKHRTVHKATYRKLSEKLWFNVFIVVEKLPICIESLFRNRLSCHLFI